MRDRITIGLVAFLLLAVPALAQGPHGKCAMGRGAGLSGSDEPLSDAGLEALGLALQDEYRAEHLYQQVLERLGDVRPFAHIVYAEQRHSAALEGVYSRRGLVAPTSDPEGLGQELPGETLQEVCKGAVEAERDNVSLYDELLRRDLPADVVQVFGHLREASLERHLPAFERCATGVVAQGPKGMGKGKGRMAGGGCCDRCEKRGAKRTGQ
jgi:rubrerythrin